MGHNCIVYTAYYTLYSNPCTLHSLQCTVYSLQLTVHSAQCTVKSEQCTVYSSKLTAYSAHSGQWPHFPRYITQDCRDLAERKPLYPGRPNTALHCRAVQCSALHCSAVQCTALHCTALAQAPRAGFGLSRSDKQRRCRLVS